jgi:hypothetical protein
MPGSAIADSDTGVYLVHTCLCSDTRPATSSSGGCSTDLNGVAVFMVGRGAVTNVGALDSIATEERIGEASTEM